MEPLYDPAAQGEQAEAPAARTRHVEKKETGSFKPDSDIGTDSFTPDSDTAAETLTSDTSSLLPDSDIGIEFHFAVKYFLFRGAYE